MMRHTTMMALVFALFTAMLLLPSPAHVNAMAQADPYAPVQTPSEATTQTQVTGNSVITCDTLPEAQGGALIGKIVPCLVFTIQESTVAFAEEMVSWLQPIMFTFLILVVAFYGVRILQNEPEVYKQGFVLLVKIAVITTILADIGNVSSFDGSGGGGKIIPAVYGVMSEAQEVVSGAITTSSLKCDISNYQGPQTPLVWAMMDCVMGKLYGFTVGTGGGGVPGAGKPSMVLMTSMAGLLSGFLFGGAWGVAVFFGMISVLLTMFTLVVRTVVGFISGYLVICLMLILSPLFLPLAFMKATAPYYESFIRTVMGAFLTPLIITAYTMLALLMYDSMLFADNSIVQRLFKYESIKNALEPMKKACDRQVTGDPTDLRTTASPTDAQRDAVLSSQNFLNIAMGTLSGGSDACNMAKVPVFKYPKVEGMVEGKEHEEMEKIFMELVQLFILAKLISAGQLQLPGIVSQLVGRNSTITGVNAIMTNNGRFQAAFEKAEHSATDAFRKDPGDKNSGFVSGGEYVKTLQKNLPTMTRNVTNSFNTLNKK